MKTEQEIEAAIRNIPDGATRFAGMSYEDGVREALDWVLGQLSDEEFEYSK